MSDKKKQSFFWVSYSDLMTSLFFIMLLLFVLASGGMYLDKEATEEQLRKIEEIQEAVKQLPTQYFEEDKEIVFYRDNLDLIEKANYYT